MTITIKRSTAAMLIGLVGILGGMAVGQVTDAVSSNGGSATASYTAGWEKDLREMVYTLRKINTKLGASVFGTSILDELNTIKGNTYGSCKEAGAFSCHN